MDHVVDAPLVGGIDLVVEGETQDGSAQVNLVAFPQAGPADSETVAADLSDEEKKTFIEWIDMGAVWDGTNDLEKD